MLQLHLDIGIRIAEKYAEARMRMHPTREIVLKVCLTPQFPKLFGDLEFDFSSEIQLVFLKDRIISRLHDVFQRDVIFRRLVVVDPSSQHHASVLLGVVRIP